MNQSLKDSNIYNLLYWITRIYTQSIASVFIVAVIAGLFGPPPQIEAPNPQQMPLFFLPWFLMSILFMLPYKLSITRRLFQSRMALYFLCSIGLIWVVIVLDTPFRKNPINLIHALPFILLAFSAPLSLYLFKKIKKSNNI
jgi:hypothetical protein